MVFRLLNANLAATYGLPACDFELEDIVDRPQYAGFTREQLLRHVGCAVCAGAFSADILVEREKEE